MTMEFEEYVRTPFVVEAAMITVDNIEEVARYIGDYEKRDDGSPYILVDPRKIPNLKFVYPGFYMTRVGDKVRCFSRRVFNQQFLKVTPEFKEWLEYIEEEKNK